MSVPYDMMYQSCMCVCVTYDDRGLPCMDEVHRMRMYYDHRHGLEIAPGVDMGNKSIFPLEVEIYLNVTSAIVSATLHSQREENSVSGQYPPGQYPPGQYLPGQHPPDNIPPDNIPPDNIPLDNIPLDNIPLDSTPSVRVRVRIRVRIRVRLGLG